MSRADEAVFPMLACSQNNSTCETTQFQYCPSLSIREHFAALAMQGLCANSSFMGSVGKHTKSLGITAEAGMATACCEMADALIAELAKVKP